MKRYANHRPDQSAFTGYQVYTVCTFDASSHVTHDSISIRDAKYAFACPRFFSRGGALRTPLPNRLFHPFASVEIVEDAENVALTIALNRRTDEFSLDSTSIIERVSPCLRLMAPFRRYS